MGLDDIKVELRGIFSDVKGAIHDAVVDRTENDLKEKLQLKTLRGADLTKENMQNVHLEGADLQGANLSYTNMPDAHLKDADLRGANMQGTFLHDADLSGAKLQGANLQGAILQRTNLQGAIFQGTDLRGADLRGGPGRSGYVDTKVTAEQLATAIIDETTKLPHGITLESIALARHSASLPKPTGLQL